MNWSCWMSTLRMTEAEICFGARVVPVGTAHAVEADLGCISKNERRRGYYGRVRK
jgi:hypothetical protein